MFVWIAWISPIFVLPGLAVIWTSWVARPRGPVAASTSVQKHDAFRRAMEAPVPTPRQPRPKPLTRTRTSR